MISATSGSPGQRCGGTRPLLDGWRPAVCERPVRTAGSRGRADRAVGWWVASGGRSVGSVPDPDVRSRALSFGSVASAYAEHRPGYAARAVAWALEPVSDLAAPHLLDLGAGTGKLSERLVGHPGARITAVEPDPAMLAELRARLPAVDARSGTAEAVPLPDRSVDAVLVGQAWHWFDAERARAEITRVLRPGGVLAVLRNGEDGHVGWVAGFLDAVEWSSRAGGAARRTFLPPGDDLVDVTEKRFANPHPTDTDSMIARLDTFSWVLTAPPAESAALREQARVYLANRPETSSGVFTLPLVTTVLRAVRSRSAGTSGAGPPG